MAATTYTGADGELAELLGDVWTSGAPSGVLDLDRIYAWRDAAVARHLAEAGAVHPAVHTPTRVMKFLERHEWKRCSVGDVAIGWEHAGRKGKGRRIFVPTVVGSDYRHRALEVLRDAAFCADLELSQVLAEVAAMPEEWVW